MPVSPDRLSPVQENENSLVSLEEQCRQSQTSPRALARLRHEVSGCLLNSFQANPESWRLLPSAVKLANTAHQYYVLGPGELAVCRKLSVPLPAPHESGQSVEKFIPTYAHLQETVNRVINQGGRIGLIFWTADGVNAGHLSVAAQAAKLKTEGHFDYFLVLMTTDLRTSLEKGEPSKTTRPMTPFVDRIAMVDQLPGVDGIYTVPVFSTPTHLNFEMMARAIACQKLETEIEGGIESTIIEGQPREYRSIRIGSLNPEKIMHLRFDENWALYVRYYLGFPLNFSIKKYLEDKVSDSIISEFNCDLGDDRCSPTSKDAADLAVDYEGPRKNELDQYLNRLWNLYPLHLRLPYLLLAEDWTQKFPRDRFLVLTTPGYDWKMARMHGRQMGFPCKTLKVSCPRTSTTVIFNHHSRLESEAHTENLGILNILKSWDGEFNFASLRQFTDWDNPFATSNLCPTDEDLRQRVWEEEC